MHIYHIFFIHSPVNGHLCYFVLAIINSASMNIGVHISFLYRVFFFSEMAESYSSSIFRFIRNLHTPYWSLQWLYQFSFPPTVWKGSLFSTPSPAFIICRGFNDGHSDWCGVIPHCSFDLYFSNKQWRWASFHVPVDHLCVFFGEISIYVFCPFFYCIICFLVVICMSYSYILEIKLLLVVLFANIFSQSIGSLFIL